MMDITESGDTVGLFIRGIMACNGIWMVMMPDKIFATATVSGGSIYIASLPIQNNGEYRQSILPVGTRSALASTPSHSAKGRRHNSPFFVEVNA